MEDWIEDKACPWVGKTIQAVYDHRSREDHYAGRDMGVKIIFTDGEELEISADCGQNWGYLIGI